jgi:DNA-binding FadR family transcriptional regulator
VHEEICSQVRRQLASGRLKPGDKLPPEREMALEFHVSGAGVREALRALENAGLVELHKGVHGGAFIRAADPMAFVQPLQDLMTLGHLSGENLAETRQQINAVAVRLACERRTADDLAALTAQLDELDGLTEPEARGEAVVRFFALIAAATHSLLWIALVESMSQVVRGLVEEAGPVRRPELQPLRRRIVSRIRAQDGAGAARAMRGYLELAQRPLLAAAH